MAIHTLSSLSSRQLSLPLSLRLLLLQPLLLLLLVLSVVHGFVPPKPGTDLAATYEPVHVYRQRRNITFDYRPKALHPESCRYLSEAACRDADESMHRHQRKHRALQKKLLQQRARQRRRRQLVGTRKESDQGWLRGSSTDWESPLSEQEELEYRMAEFQKVLRELTQHMNEKSGQWRKPVTPEEREELEEFLKEHDVTHPEYKYKPNNNNSTNALDQRQLLDGNPRVGTFRVLILLMQFTDHASRPLPDKYEYQVLWNLRIRRWLTQNSYGNYDAFFEVRPWQLSDNTEDHYSFGQSGRLGEFQNSFWPLLNALDSDSNWDWSLYDVNSDGLLDNLIILHSGYAAEEGGADCTNGREYLNRIWSHAFSSSNGWRNSAATYGVEGYMIASALDLTCDSNPAHMGVMTHEYLHTFKLIDLYDYTFEGKGVGTFDIMAYPYGFANDGYLPNSMTVWAKSAIDWLTCQVVSSSGTFTLQPAAMYPSCIKILLQTSPDGKEEYLLIENRQQISFDVDLWKAGVMIYHIDDAADEQYARGFPGQGGWPGNGQHYQVAVLQADGLYNLEKNENNGDEGDMYTSGMSLGPNQDGNTYPNTDMYQFGAIQRSGVVIEIGEQQGNDFQVTVNFQGRSADDESVNKPSVFEAPSKERPEEAEEQFRTPDADEYRMSGKIPQLGWFDEQKAYQAHGTVTDASAIASSASNVWRESLFFAALVSAVMADLLGPCSGWI